MGLFSDIFWAVIMVGLPVAAFTTAIVWWGFQKGAFSELLDTRALGREISAMKKNNKAKKKLEKEAPANSREVHFVQKKWTKFGGGFYGIVGFFTYIVIEFLEIISMIRNFGGFFEFLKNYGLDVIINIIVSALSNFVAALVWPVYWMRRIDSGNVWIWFVVAYAGYWLGLKLAQTMVQRKAIAKN